MSRSNLETTKHVYKELAGNPQVGLCCTSTPIRPLSGLSSPNKMRQINYGCGNTAASKPGTMLQKRVYAPVQESTKETKAKYCYSEITAVDLVDMPTALEVIAASPPQFSFVVHYAVRNECHPDSLKPVNITEIIEGAGKTDSGLACLFAETVKTLP